MVNSRAGRIGTAGQVMNHNPNPRRSSAINRRPVSAYSSNQSAVGGQTRSAPRDRPFGGVHTDGASVVLSLCFLARRSQLPEQLVKAVALGGGGVVVRGTTETPSAGLAGMSLVPSPFRSAGHGSGASRTRPPVGEQGEEVGDADGAVTIEVRRSATPNSRGE